MESLFPYVPLCLSFAARVNVRQQSACHCLCSLCYTTLSADIYWVCVRKSEICFVSLVNIEWCLLCKLNSFVQQKHIIDYKTTQFCIFATCEWVLESRQRGKIALGRNV